MEDEALEETLLVLRDIPGGPEVIEWFHGGPQFGDAEVLELRLVRRGASVLRLAAIALEAGGYKSAPLKHAIFDFVLRDMIDVHLDGFSHQNVIGGLNLRRATEQKFHPSLVGIGLVAGEVEMQLDPCAGSFGCMRCTIEKISITPVVNDQKADEIGAKAPLASSLLRSRRREGQGCALNCSLGPWAGAHQR